jgi:hypothetical protein
MRRTVARAFERLLRPACLAGLVLLIGCRVKDDLVAEHVLNSSGGAPGGSSTTGGDGGLAASTSDCSPDRASISVPLAGGARRTRCSAWAARRSFTNALCSCSDLNVRGALVTDAFDSSQSDAGSGRGAAAVGVKGAYQGADYVRVDGSFTVASDAGIDSPGGLDIAGDLRLAGATKAAGPILVSRDAWLGGETTTLSVANIGRNLHLSANATLQPLVPAVVGGDTFRDSFETPPPCACGAEDTLDIAGIVAGTLADNDNSLIGLELDALADVAAPTELTLRCGRFALRGISGRAAISLRVSGRVSLVVDGDVLIPPGFTLVLEPEAQLDWFISGSLPLSPDTRIGDKERASAVRVYVLGKNEIVLPGTELVTMNVYAPQASVTVEALGNAYGAVFADAIASRGLLFMHYDRAVLRADEACSFSPPAICTSCDECHAASTCLSGACAACVNDADCCFPLACEQGQCQGLVAN